MKIFKFGGASVKSAEAIKQVAKIIEMETEPLVVVVSAMGKMTNKLEELCNDFFYKKGNAYMILEDVRRFHFEVIEGLFDEDVWTVKTKIESLFHKLQEIVATEPSICYDFEYDRIVSFGERISTAIISEYLNSVLLENQLVDIRTALKTDNNYRDANIEIEKIEDKVVIKIFNSFNIPFDTYNNIFNAFINCILL